MRPSVMAFAAMMTVVIIVLHLSGRKESSLHKDVQNGLSPETSLTAIQSISGHPSDAGIDKPSVIDGPASENQVKDVDASPKTVQGSNVTIVPQTRLAIWDNKLSEQVAQSLPNQPDHGTQTNRHPTRASALPPAHLASLIANADEAEVVEESTNSSQAAAASDLNQPKNLGSSHQQVNADVSEDSTQAAGDLVTAFRNATSDKAKIELLSMVVQQDAGNQSQILIKLGLANTQSEDVRIQAVYLAGSIAPELLNYYTYDASEAVRNEVRLQLDMIP